jgi:O-antigen polysaccharide polymerase Wzy
VSAYLGLFLVLLVILLIYTRLSRHPLDPVALFCYCFCFYYVYRDAVITFGWDVPYPDYLFISGETPHLLVKASLAITGFLVCYAIGYLVCAPHAAGLARFVPACWTEPPVKRHIRLVVVLTIVATFISIVLAGRYGGISGMIRAGKKTGSLAGLYELRIFPSIGAMMAAALALTLWQRRLETGRRTPAILAALAALLNAGYVFMWGSRTAVGGVMVIFIAGQWILRRPREEKQREGIVERATRPRVMMVAALVLIMFASVIGLRLFRDTVLTGHVNKSLQGQTRVRQVSVSTNSFVFDSMLLLVRDWPSTYPYRGGQDFVIGAEGIVPRVLWPGKPVDVRVGSWFRQVYQPTATNGWGLGAAGDWFLNFGIFGLVVGGLLSGALFGVLSSAWWRAAWTPITLASITCVVLFVVPTGINALSVLRWVQWAVPLLFCTMYLDRPSGARKTERLARLGLEAQGS